MRKADPFPVPEYQGLEPTQPLDWPAMARKIIRDVLKLDRHERVILSANPYYGGAMLDAMRTEVQRAGAIELATILHWTPALAMLRAPDGCKPDPDDRAAEDEAIRRLFAIADAFIWLMNDWRSGRATHAVGQTELALETWPGRSVHFHWFHDPNDPDPDSPANKAIDRVYEAAILELDYRALRRTMDALAERMADRTVRITNGAGTDLSFVLTSQFHKNFGDASRGRAATARSTRDREEEIPCGALRTIPVRDSVDGVIAFERGFGFPVAGVGLDFTGFLETGLRIRFRGGRIVGLQTGGDQGLMDRLWAAETGDKDRLGEMVLGCNPLLRKVPGSSFPPYYGFGEGVLRLTIGDNRESGGLNRSSLHRWLYLLDATIRADDIPLVEDGKLVRRALGIA